MMMYFAGFPGIRTAVLVLVGQLVLLQANGPALAQSADAGDQRIVGRVGEWTVTLADVDQRALSLDAGQFRSLRLRDALHEARRQTLDALIAERLIDLEASRRAISTEDLLEQEVERRIAPVTDTEVSAWYEQNRARVNNAPLESVAGNIRDFLERSRRQEAVNRLVSSLTAKTTVTVALEPPRDPITVAADEPARGPADAPVEIVVYSDFQCPYCGRVVPALEKVLEANSETVRLVFRDFPITAIHPLAVGAAIAARCAHEQGKFWEYHDRLFANQGRLANEDLKQHAAALGLDAEQFSSCLDQEKTRPLVEEAAASGERLGISATPAFFINGRLLSGAQPYEAFQSIIDDELQRRLEAPQP
jgi:protein-disulfide isomerase